MRVRADKLWEWCQQNEDPAAMAFAERLANLLEPELDAVDLTKGGRIQDTMRVILRDKLREAGADRLTDAQRSCAFLRLNQCWGAYWYSVALDQALDELGLIPSSSS